MTSAAVQAARAVGYRNAGTVEFLLDVSQQDRDNAPFYFLEMNTRLQVEHGVTELVVGIDLVRAQLLVASGEPLPWSQQQLIQRGHAVEARLYAEDPDRDFLPQAGRLLLYREPHMPGIRIDSGFREGDEVSVHYDPLLAKIIAAAETRAQAVQRLIAALRAFPVLGIRTNVPLLLSVLGDSRFAAGSIDTRFLDRDGAALTGPPDGTVPDHVRAAFAAAAAARPTLLEETVRPSDPWQTLLNWRAS
jgi:acetyl/propionyl-CoA carboxylase alpha subunit